MYDFDHILAPENVNPGLADSVYIAPILWFNDVKEPSDDGFTKATRILVNDDHDFIPSKGFLENVTKPFSTQYNFTDRQSLLSTFLLGSYEALHASISVLENIPLIVLCRDTSCEEGVIYQLGTFDFPAYLKGAFDTGTARGGQPKGYNITITSYFATPIIYKGQIQIIDTLPKYFATEDGRILISESHIPFTT